MISVIILAGGQGSRLGLAGVPKALVELCGKPMISYVLDVASLLSRDVVVVVSSREQEDALLNSGALGDARLVVDDAGLGPPCPLLGLVSGLSAVKEPLALALTCDVPFASRDVLAFLADVVSFMNAAVPRWPNGYVEPLQAVYRVGAALEAGKQVLKAGEDLSMRAFLRALGRVRYISTRVLEQLDPGLNTFLNVNTPSDLRRAEMMLRARGRCARRLAGPGGAQRGSRELRS